MNATDPTLANILQIQGNLEHYHVPKYQREYTWGRNEWEQLLIDIEENDIGYFMGSIICIDDNHELGPGESRIFEVVVMSACSQLPLVSCAYRERIFPNKANSAEAKSRAAD